MWPTLLFGLLLASVAGWIFTAYYQTRRIRRLERSHEEIQVEETLVFDFLHGLGEAFSGTIRPQELHRLIVEGATRILDAHGAALYMTDRTGGKLTPAFISKGWPPLVDVPPNILQQAAATPIALESYLRLHSVTPGEGLIGRVWQTGQSLYLNDLSEVPELAKLRGSAFGAASVMAAALSYAKQDLGVLALANGPTGALFSQADFVVFKSIAEQSAFALYNAIIYSMANVSGKGVPASLIMAICRSVLRAEAARNPSPADVLRKVNRQLYPDIKEDMFISMAYLVLDHQHDGVTLARAGHDAPLWYQRQSQTVTPVKSPGMVVGIDSGSVFDRLTVDFAVPLERNDCLVLYSDGVTETLNSDGDEFGVDRMMQSVRASANDGAQAIVKRIIEDVREFTGSVPQNDDMTLIAIRKT